MINLTRLLRISLSAAAAAAALLGAAANLHATPTTWTGDTPEHVSDYLFSTGANWSTGVAPGSGSALIIGSSTPLYFDNGAPFSASSLTIASGVDAFLGVAFGGDTLSLGSGGLVNHGDGVSFNLTLLATATQAWAIAGGSLALNDTFNVTAGTLSISLGAGGAFDFGMAASNPDWAGSIGFTAVTSSTAIRVSGGGLTAQNTGRITINGAAASLDGGYLTSAAISAVPEPSTYAAIAGAGGLALALWRRGRMRSPRG